MFWVSLALAASFDHKVILPRLHSAKKLILEAVWSLDRGGQLCECVSVSMCEYVHTSMLEEWSTKHDKIVDGEREET